MINSCCDSINSCYGYSIKRELLPQQKNEIEKYLYSEDFDEQYFLYLVKEFRKLRKEIIDEEHKMDERYNNSKKYAKNFEEILGDLIKKNKKVKI